MYFTQHDYIATTSNDYCVSIQALGTGLKGSSRPLKSSYMDTITAKALRVQKEIDNVWPHNRLGYTIDGSSLHKHRELSDFEESVNFIQATTCGQNTQGIPRGNWD